MGDVFRMLSQHLAGVVNAANFVFQTAQLASCQLEDAALVVHSSKCDE